MKTTVERIGICRRKGTEHFTLFHRLKVKLSRKYKVWPFHGSDRFLMYDPAEYMDNWETVEAHKPEKQLAP